MTLQGTLETVIRDGIATISFGHPAGNSFPSALLARLTLELEKTSQDDSIRVIVLKSQGEGPFCAGASFDELLQISNLEEGTRFFSGFANVINAMRKSQKIIIGRIHGKAVGGGVGLAAACDYSFAVESAAIKLSELAIGIGPFVIAPAVERKMGLAAFTELSLEPNIWKSASWAQTRGLYSKVYPAISDLDNEIAEFSTRLAQYNPDALSGLKRTYWNGTEHWGSLLYERAAISGNLVLSDFCKKALIAFQK